MKKRPGKQVKRDYLKMRPIKQTIDLSKMRPVREPIYEKETYGRDLLTRYGPYVKRDLVHMKRDLYG